jgi:hypothetical protein
MTDVSLTTNNGYVFTFANGEVEDIKSNLQADLTYVSKAKTGPMSNVTYDYTGVKKILTVRGILVSTTTSRVSGYSINTAVEQKQWLESLVNGNQKAIKFTSNYESLSVLSKLGATAPYESAFTNTYVRIQNISFSEKNGLVDQIPFTMSLIVSQ